MGGEADCRASCAGCGTCAAKAMGPPACSGIGAGRCPPCADDDTGRHAAAPNGPSSSPVATPPAPVAADVAALLNPYCAFIEARASLERLDHGAVDEAANAFARAIDAEPSFAGAHVGLANARLFAFERTRADVEPDLAALAAAERHARHAARAV